MRLQRRASRSSRTTTAKSGTNQFRVLGRKITVARPDLGEELYVIDAAGEKIAASIDNGEEAGQRINATLGKKPALARERSSL